MYLKQIYIFIHSNEKDFDTKSYPLICFYILPILNEDVQLANGSR